MKKPLGVYVHIPFCRSKCLYCAFNSSAIATFSPVEWVKLFGDELSCHLRGEAFSEDTHKLTSIYFGGGTPSLFPPSAVGAIISLLKDTFPACEDLEVTLEANPEGLGLAELAGFLEAGVCRLSLGVQSLDDGELKRLGRRHGADEALTAVKNAARAGFDNLSLDLMYGLPGQTLKSWTKTLRAVLGLSPAHISLYNLSIEEHTPFYKRYGGPQQKPFMDEDLELSMYERAMDKLRASGYVHYEISNFARPGFKSRHNEAYWLGRDYIGLGPGAHSFSAPSEPGRWGIRSWNEADIETYKRALGKGSPAAGSEILSRDEAMVEAVLLGMRMLDKGIDLKRFTSDFGAQARRRLLEKCRDLEGRGFVHIRDERVVLDRSALFTSNEVCLALVS